MEPNPYLAPGAELERPEAVEGRLLPFEDPQAGNLAIRAFRTVKWILRAPTLAGEGIRAGRGLGYAIGFLALVGMLPAVLLNVWRVLHPLTFHPGLPPTPLRAPVGAVLLERLEWVVFLAPLLAFLGIALAGLPRHWVLRRLGRARENAGLLATYRSGLYANGVSMLISIGPGLLKRIFPIVDWPSQLLLFGLVVFDGCWQGLLLARTHRTDAWRGLVAVWFVTLALAMLAIAITLLWFSLTRHPLPVFFRELLRVLH